MECLCLFVEFGVMDFVLFVYVLYDWCSFELVVYEVVFVLWVEGVLV